MKRVLSLLLIVLVSSSMAFAQEGYQKKTKRYKADQAFLVQNYYEAAALYKEAYLKEKNRAKKAELTFLQAECWRLIGTPQGIKKSESMYKRTIKAKYPHAEVYLRYAQVLHLQQKFDEAAEQYAKYDKLKPGDDRAKNGIESCKFAKECLDNPSRYEVEPLDMANSRANDFAPSFGNGDYDLLYFTSSRDGGIGKGADGQTGHAYTDLWSLKRDRKGKWSKPVVFPEPMNTEAHEAATSLTKRGNEMFFTRCEQSSKEKPMPTCEIYYTKKKGKGWIAPVLLPLPYDSVTTFGHPCVSEDGKTLYFASDMKGGFGGKDIWMIKKEKRDEWSQPVNLGERINTNGNELFPFIHADGALYFSSNGHVGMGGMDIYKAEFDTEGNLVSISNMKSPMNSPTDDFGIVFEGKSERGYFASNRTGGKGGDDIYQFNLPSLILTLSGVATDSKTGEVIAGASISLMGTDGTTATVITDNAGRYEFGKEIINEGVAYELSIEKEGYLSTTATETTFGIAESQDFVLDFSLEPTKKEIILPRIEYDFNSASLREESKMALDALVSVLLDNPTVIIELRSHTDYRAGDDFNLKLSQERAQVCVDYMVSKGVAAARLIPMGMGETEPFVMMQKDGRLKAGATLNEAYVSKMRREKDREKAHQYNRRTDFKVLDIFYNPETGEILDTNDK
jgi:peptidoglycan-associated lipoprotein